jgi:hypothetical protein
MSFRGLVRLLPFFALIACDRTGAATTGLAIADGGPAAPCLDPTEYRFVPEIGDASEGYVCFGFDPGSLASGTVGGVIWNAPATGALLLHHATLYAVPFDFPDGPIACDGMPAGAVGLDVWTPGASALSLPADTGLRLPPETLRFVVEAHTIRVGTGPVEDGRVTICRGPDEPAHLAALLTASAPVPAIRPEHSETSEATCVLQGDVHLWSIWPHMHLAGQEIAVDWMQADAAATSLVDVMPWNFYAQKRYPLSIDAFGGDRIATRCRWQNTTESYILPGPLTENEMCNVVIIAWPADQAGCH